MTRIAYDFEVIASGPEGMTVRYTNPTYGSMDVGVRLPYQGELLEDVVAQFSPAFFWEEQGRVRVVVPEGTTGTGETQVGPVSQDFTEAELLEIWRDGMWIDRFQALQTLSVWGLKDQAEAQAALMGGAVELGFQTSPQWRRSSTGLTALLSEITMVTGEKMSPTDIDQFFIQAKEVTL